MAPWIATVLPSVPVVPPPPEALDFVVSTSRELLAKPGPGVIVFPAGWINTGPEEPKTRYSEIETQAASLLKTLQRDTVICIGVDGRFGNDQTAVAISADGIIATGRKFCRTVDERKSGVVRAENYLSEEDGRSRLFTFCGRRFFLLVCYDAFGLTRLELANPGVDVLIAHVHGFWPRGQLGSSHQEFARKGLAGASKQFKCPVFASGVFFSRPVEPNWPSGILWTKGTRASRTGVTRTTR
jgi:predicted amidohydrolase